MYKATIQTSDGQSVTAYFDDDELDRFLVEEIGYSPDGAKGARRDIDWHKPYESESVRVEKVV